MLTSQKFLSDEEDQQLVATLAKYKNRDTLMLYILYQYGMRSSELLALKKCDVNLAGPSFFIRGSKGSRDREFPLELHVFRRLLAEMEKCKEDSERIFKVGYDRLHDIWATYRPVRKKLHSLRHSRGMATLKKTGDIRMVQKVLGHKNINSTMCYLDFSVSQDEFKNILFG